MPKIFALIALAAFVSATSVHAAAPDTANAPAATESGWQAPAGLTQIPLWPQGAPDMPAGPKPEEKVFAVKKVPGRHYLGIADVTVPTITVFKPEQERDTGAAMLVFPGGGFRILAMDIEGTEICDWVTGMGMTCILLKYRVPKSNHYWDSEAKRHITPAVPLALQDAQRAIRLVRSQADALGIHPDKIGVIGFSAGGYLVAQTSNITTSTYRPVDAIDGLSSRPDFAIALYPGHLCRAGATLDPTIQVTAQTPPTFLLQAWDDPVDDICNSTLYARALDDAGVPAEVHLFAKGGHAFGLRQTGRQISSWPALVENWLKDLEVLHAAK